jgi:hypothetical protein
MNLFRSEEHVKRWSLYDPASEDYIMALADWAQVFSGPMQRSRLDPDTLARSAEYLSAYHGELHKLGKKTSFWMIPFIRDLPAVPLSRYRVVGDTIRYEDRVLHSLKDVRARIAGGFDQPGHRRNNHLLWAPPGSGKTYFVQQVARALQGRGEYLELNLARTPEDNFRRALESLPGRLARCWFWWMKSMPGRAKPGPMRRCCRISIWPPNTGRRWASSWLAAHPTVWMR